MYVLGVETSCDETSCSVVNNRSVLSNSIVSSLNSHKKYGGIIPEIATRSHAKFIDKVCEHALSQANIGLKDIKAIGVTFKPGLIGALVVGVNFAKALSIGLNKPFLGINHLHAHLFSPFLNNKKKFNFPFVGLVVSGGHTEIFDVKDFDKIKTLGKTRDDAAGEVFDKVARNFGLGYPGGVYIDKMYDYNLRDSFKFKCGDLGLDFSFSGIKTALIYKKIELEKKRKFNQDIKLKLISSFQESVVNTIVDNTIKAAKKVRAKSICCGGGVMANSRLRQLLTKKACEEGLNLLLPEKKFTADNAAMVAGLAFYLYNKNRKTDSLKLLVSSR